MTTLTYGPPPSPLFEVSPTAEDIAAFRKNGFITVERLTSDEEIAWLRKIFEDIFDENRKSGGPVDRSGKLAEGEAGTLSQAFFPEMQFPEILDSAFRRNAKRYAAALLDVDEGRLTSWGHMIRKAPGGREVSWHQDHAYWQPELEYHALGCWLPLHDVSVEMGAMQFIPGSHKRGLLRHRHMEDPIHNLLAADEPFDKSTAVACPLKAGGATFHHAETLHFTAVNRTPRHRMAFPMEFQVAPVRRATPEVMPWVDEYRASAGPDRTVSGRPAAINYVADGRFITV